MHDSLWVRASAAWTFFAIVGVAQAQFFVGAPTPVFSTTAGTIGLTPTTTANQLTQEIDVNGQFTVINAVSSAANPFETSSFSVTCGLDPTFNGGVPLVMQMQISQSGFVSVPIGGQIYGWTLDAYVNSLNVVTANAPGAPFFAGTTTYGPTVTLGTPFIYMPGGTFLLTFSSDFDGLGVPNTYVWDFPLGFQFVVVPEPTSIAFIALGAFAVGRIWRRRSMATAHRMN